MKFSIIIPAYNSEKYIDRCIQSILKQSYTNFELIIINDGSTDDTLKKCQGYVDSRIRLFSQKNSGVSSARNYGLKKACGDWIFFVDSDDYLVETALQTIENHLLKEDTDFVMLNYQGNIDHINFLYNEILYNSSVRGYVWNKLFNNSILKSRNIFFHENLHMAEDLVFVIEYINSIKKYSVIDDVVYIYNKNSNTSISNMKFNIKQLSIIDSYDYLINYMTEKKVSLDIINAYRCRKISHCLSLIHRCRKYCDKVDEKDIYMSRLKIEISKMGLNYIKSKESFKHKIGFIYFKLWRHK